MSAFIEGKWIDFSKYEYFGGMTDDAAYEDLYRTPDGSWSLHTRHVAALKEATLHTIPEEEAVGWVIRLRHSQEGEVIQGPMRRARSSVPEWVVPREEYHRCEKEVRTGPPPMGQQVDLLLPYDSPTAEQIEARQMRLLEPGRVLEYLMWPSPVDVAMTADFREERHDPLVERLQEELESKLFESPRLFLTQSLQDRGCDLVIEWPQRAKYGVQLKSNGDVTETNFANKTIAQIQDSRQHNLWRLYVILAADITGNSNAQKVRGLMSRISAMNDPYVVAVPPERVWNLLFPERRVVS